MIKIIKINRIIIKNRRLLLFCDEKKKEMGEKMYISLFGKNGKMMVFLSFERVNLK